MLNGGESKKRCHTVVNEYEFPDGFIIILLFKTCHFNTVPLCAAPSLEHSACPFFPAMPGYIFWVSWNGGFSSMPPFTRSLTNCFCLQGSMLFDVQTPSFSQRRLTAGAEREADGPRQDAANLTSLSPFQVLWFNQPLPHKLLWSTFEILVSAQ